MYLVVAILLYLAKFCLLGLLYISVYVVSRQVFAQVQSDPITDVFEDLEPGSLWLVPREPVSGIPEAGRACNKQLVIGRNQECDICLDDPFVSQYHAKLIPSSGFCTLQDMGSANGTRLNSELVQGIVRMEEGACLSIGDATFRLVRKEE